MANKEHVEIVRQGCNAILKWREGNPGERMNLSSANLSYANLSYADLSYADLSSADLSSADLIYANLSSADLSSADLSSADLIYANLRSANGNGREIKTINVDTYQINIVASTQIMHIGCESHTLQEWYDFNDESIEAMDGSESLDWWREWKDWIFQCVEKVVPEFKENTLTSDTSSE